MYGLVANVASDKALRTNAKVYIKRLQDGGNNTEVCGLSKGGRWIHKHLHAKRLENIRAAWLPGHMRDTVIDKYTDKNSAQRQARILNKIFTSMQRFSPDGSTRLKEGLSETQAYAMFGLEKPI